MAGKYIRLFAASAAAFFLCTSLADAPAERTVTDGGAGSVAWKRYPNGDLELGCIRLHRKEMTLSFPAQVNMVEGELEVLIASPTGRLHESLFRTEAVPLHLQTMLLLLGLRNGPRLPDAKGRQGDLVDIDVEWTDHDGRVHRDPIEEWIMDRRRHGPMRRIGWVFTGSAIQNGRFLPNIEGNLVLLFSSGETVLDIPDPESIDDTLFTVNSKRARAAGDDAKVRIIVIPRRERNADAR